MDPKDIFSLGRGGERMDHWIGALWILFWEAFGRGIVWMTDREISKRDLVLCIY